MNRTTPVHEYKTDTVGVYPLVFPLVFPPTGNTSGNGVRLRFCGRSAPGRYRSGYLQDVIKSGPADYFRGKDGVPPRGGKGGGDGGSRPRTGGWVEPLPRAASRP